MNESYIIWGIGLLAAALLLVMLEAFLPTAGMIGLVAAAVAIGGNVVLFKVSIAWGVIGIVAFIGLGGVGFLFALSIMPSTRFGRRLVHGDDPNVRDDDDDAGPPPADPNAEFEHLVGQQGTAVTDLRPVGAIKIGDARYHAHAEVSYIRSGTRVRVTSADGTQIKVRPVV